MVRFGYKLMVNIELVPNQKKIAYLYENSLQWTKFVISRLMLMILEIICFWNFFYFFFVSFRSVAAEREFLLPLHCYILLKFHAHLKFNAVADESVAIAKYIKIFNFLNFASFLLLLLLLSKTYSKLNARDLLSEC